MTGLLPCRSLGCHLPAVSQGLPASLPTRVHGAISSAQAGFSHRDRPQPRPSPPWKQVPPEPAHPSSRAGSTPAWPLPTQLRPGTPRRDSAPRPPPPPAAGRSPCLSLPRGPRLVLQALITPTGLPVHLPSLEPRSLGGRTAHRPVRCAWAAAWHPPLCPSERGREWEVWSALGGQRAGQVPC